MVLSHYQPTKFVSPVPLNYVTFQRLTTIYLQGTDMPGAEHVHGDKPAEPKSKLSEMLDMMKNKPMDPNGMGLVKRLSTGFCKDCTVLAGKVDVVFANGTKAGINNGVYLHHAVTVSLMSPSNFVVIEAGES